MPLCLSVLLTCTSACLNKRRVLCLVCFSLNSVANKGFSCLILKSALGVFCQNSFALLVRPGLLKPVSAAKKFIAAVVKEYFTRLPSEDINSSIYSRAFCRAVMVSSQFKRGCCCCMIFSKQCLHLKQQKNGSLEIYQLAYQKRFKYLTGS